MRFWHGSEKHPGCLVGKLARLDQTAGQAIIKVGRAGSLRSCPDHEYPGYLIGKLARRDSTTALPVNHGRPQRKFAVVS